MKIWAKKTYWRGMACFLFELGLRTKRYSRVLEFRRDWDNSFLIRWAKFDRGFDFSDEEAQEIAHDLSLLR